MNKQKLGEMICFLRKEKYRVTKDKKWSQSNFCEGICAKSTLIRIESGEISRSEEVYKELSKKLGFQYASIDVIDYNIKVLEEELLSEMIMGDEEKIIEVLIKMEGILILSKELIYYYQQLLIVEILLGYYRSKEFKLAYPIKSNIKMIHLFSESFGSAIRVYLYHYIHYSMENSEFKEYTAFLGLRDDSFLLSQICYFHLLFVECRGNTLEVFDDIWKICTQQNNLKRMKEVQSILRLYEVHFEKPLPEKYQGIIELNIKEDSAMALLNEVVNLEKHEMKETYEKLFKKYESLPIHSLISYNTNFQGETILNQMIKTKRFFGRESYNHYLKYLELEGDEFQKQEYIMDILYPYLKDCEPLFLEYFTEEVHRLCRTTNRYKDFHMMVDLFKDSGDYIHKHNK